MVQSVVRTLLCMTMMATCVVEAQVVRKIDMHKLSSDEMATIEMRAKRGEARSMTIMGIVYAEGLNVAKDLNRAVMWLRKASKTDDIAQEYLGTMLRNGTGVPKDAAAARALFAKSAAQGNLRAQFNYASLCFNGDGGPQDVDQAAKYFEIAAREGDATSEHMIARMYQYGRGVAKDPEQAERWYQAAAKQNYAPSMFALGLALLEGDLGAVDRERGEQYLERAAALGDWSAAMRIAKLYLDGEGTIARNERVAYKWFAIARDMSGADLNPAMTSLEGRMQAMEVASTQQEVKHWETEHLR